jgi:hypothetical protein
VVQWSASGELVVMPYNFVQAEQAYRNDNISELGCDRNGMRFLLLRSLSRREHMERLAEENGIDLDGIPSKQRLSFLFESEISEDRIKETIEQIYSEEREARLEQEPQLVSELYRMQAFDWGGLHQNSLEKTIINNYVKKIRGFERLNESIDNELFSSMRGYVQCSWYNHWTSIMIEDIFKDHPTVLPAVGLIKKVDFFVAETPFDLKVTYLPEGFIKDKRKEKTLRPELTLLKQCARKLKLQFDSKMSPAKLLEYLWTRVSDHPSEKANTLIEELTEERETILNSCLKNPEELIKWLYENQGERRFDSSNRLFLVLANTGNYFDSWKLKRARDLLVSRINKDLYEGEFGRNVEFEWEGENYTTVADIIFVTHAA